jgi:hypothetical protein
MAFDPLADMAAPAPAAAPVAPAGDPAELERFKAVPGFAAVIAGEVPAVFGPLSVLPQPQNDALTKLQNHASSVGLGFAQAPKAGAFVVFDPKAYTPEEITQADADGSLSTIAASMGPASNAATPESTAVPSAEPNATPSPAANVIAANSPASTALAPVRAAGINPQPASQRAMPAQGILDQLTKRAV